MPQAVIFDLDGTLVDPVDFHAESRARSCRHFGHEADTGTVGRLCGGLPEDVRREAGCIALYRDPAALLEGYAASPLAR